MPDTVFVAAISGLAGALAGGLVSLISQILNRKWQKEDSLHQIKREFYSEMSSIGSQYVGWEVFGKINKTAARCLLIANKNLTRTIVEYMSLINELNLSLEEEGPSKHREVVRRYTTRVILAEKRMIEEMQKDLGYFKFGPIYKLKNIFKKS